MKKINNFFILVLLGVGFLSVIDSSQKNKSKKPQSKVKKKITQPQSNNGNNGAVAEQLVDVNDVSNVNNDDNSNASNDGTVNSSMTQEQVEEEIKKSSLFAQTTQKFNSATKMQLLSLAASLVMGGTTIVWALNRAKEYFSGTKKNTKPSKEEIDKMVKEGNKQKPNSENDLKSQILNINKKNLNSSVFFDEKKENNDNEENDNDFSSVTSEDEDFYNNRDATLEDDDEQNETNKPKTNKEQYEELTKNQKEYVTSSDDFSGDLPIKKLKSDGDTSSIMSDSDDDRESDFEDDDNDFKPKGSEEGSNDSNSSTSHNSNDDRINDFDEEDKEKKNEKVNNVKEDNIKQQEPKVVEEPKKGFLKDKWEKLKGGASSVKDGMLNALNYVNPFAKGKNNTVNSAEPNIIIKKPLVEDKPKNYRSKDDMDIPPKKQNTGNVNNPRRSFEEGDASNNKSFFNSEKKEDKFEDLPQKNIHKPGDQDKFVINDPNGLLNALPKSTAQNVIEKHQTEKNKARLKNNPSLNTIEEFPGGEDEDEENDDEESVSDTNSTISHNDQDRRIKEDFGEEDGAVVDNQVDLINNFKKKLTEVKDELRSKITNNKDYHGSLLKQYQKVCDLLSLDGDFIKKNFSDEDIDNFMKSENNNGIDILFNKATEKGFVSKTDYLKDIIKDNIIEGKDKTLEWDKVVPKKIGWLRNSDDKAGIEKHKAEIVKHIETHKINTTKSEKILNSFYSKSKELTHEGRSKMILE